MLLEEVLEVDLEVVEPCQGPQGFEVFMVADEPGQLPHGWPLFLPVQKGLIDAGQTVTVRVEVTTVVSSVLYVRAWPRARKVKNVGLNNIMAKE